MSPAPAVKQGIAVAIMGCEGGDRGRTSLRRTLSADMSSKQWLAQNGFGLSSPPLIKKTASSRDLFLNPIADSFSDEDDDEEGKQVPLPNFDIWTSIVSPAKSAADSLPPPYVHPLVKRSASSLSENSLQICTESLGSETGSDGFSSDAESDHDSDRKPAAAMALSPSPSPAPARSFPPPLASLSCRGVGDCAPALRMRSRRDNGRLVVEAVAVPTTPPNFSAQRVDGRLVLKLARSSETFEETGELEEQQFKNYDSEEEEEEKYVPRTVEMAESRLINFHRLALMANKPLGTFPNRNVKEGEDQKPVAKSLPPRVPVSRLIPAPAAAKVSTTAAASLNHYDYFWRTKIGSQNDGFKSQTPASNDRKEFVVSKVDGYHLVPLLKGCCNEPRRTLIWHPRCIATS